MIIPRGKTEVSVIPEFPETFTKYLVSKEKLNSEVKVKIFALATVLVALIHFTVLGDSTDPGRLKAKYYFMQGALEASENNMASAFEYFKKAYEIDPTFSDAAFNYGSQRMFVPSDTLQSHNELRKSLALMQQYVDDFPNDLYAAQMYGFIASRLDTVNESIRVYERVYANMPKETQLLVNLAEAYMMAQRGKEAVEALNRYESIEGKSAQTSLKKVSFFLAQKDTLKAVDEVEELIKTNPRDPFNYLLKGNLYEVLANPDSVFDAYKKAESLAPENGAVKISLANHYRSIGDTVMLDNMMYEALLSEDFEIEEKIGILGDYLQKLIDEQGEKSRGDYLFNVLMEQYPHEPALLDMSARYSAAKGDFKAAAEEIEYAIDLDATNEKYWLMLMSYLLAESDYPALITTYDKARLHVVPSIAMKNIYAGAASQIEDINEGKTIINGLLEEISPELTIEDKDTIEKLRKSLDYDNLVWVSTLYCILGDLDYKNGDSEEAFKAYEASLRFFSDNALALNNYAYFLSEENKELEKAKTMSRRSLDLSENNPTYLDTYAWILYKIGELQEALEYQKLAMELATQEGDDNEEFKKHLEAIEKALEE